ncbi:MAG TPA: YicC/YloC family endoribonuclease [Bryobacteraceae bacterium]|nr:YicC/YloC family endoribonuclease [Bryobacteraceae bacterium]
MIRSMTGFARARKTTEDGEIVLSVKSLNHRGLDLHFHLPVVFDAYENAMREALKHKVARGHVDIRVVWHPVRSTGSAGLNRPLLDTYIAGFREAARQYGIAGEPDLNAALRVPGMFSDTDDAEVSPGVQAVLMAALAEALEELNAFRAREGAQLASLMLERNQAIASAAERLETLRLGAVQAFENRLTERLAELLRGVAVEPQRLAQEAAILADRSDIGEEIARLKIHSGQLQQLLEGGTETGKKIDFLLQEMNRETNTILSKSTGLGEMGMEITNLGLAVKSDIEKIREQALNLE